MRTFALALTLAMLPTSAIAAPRIFAATLADTDAGFKTLADCEIALRGSGEVRARANAHSAQRGTLFNRTNGNISRCEMVHGEPTIVVYPKGYVGKIAP